MIKKILEWFGVGFFVILALAAFSLGGFFSGIILLLLAFVCSPYRYILLNLLPEKLKKSIVVIATSVILFFASMIGIPTDSSPDLNSDIVEDVAESSTEVEERTMPSNVNEEESEDTSSALAKEDDTQKEKEADVTQEDVAQKVASEEAEKKAAEENAAAQKKAEEELAAQKAEEEAATKKAAEEAAVAQRAAEEEAAAQKAVETAAVAQTTPQANSSTVANGTESANALKVLQMGPTTGSPCWVPRNGGKKYHSNSSCSGMDDPIYTTVDTATACGFDACKKCH